MASTFEQIIKDLKKKIYKPIYFLMGEESYYIDEITSFIEKNVLTEDEKAFNQTILYGKDIDLSVLLNSARKYPMMANYNVVILKEGQNLKGLEGSAGDKDPFLMYIKEPLESTILVINYRDKTIKKNTKVYKAIDKVGVIFESKKIYENKVSGWITQYVKNKGYFIDTVAAELMANHLGNDLSKVSQEIEKLFVSILKGQTITQKDIEENIGISKDFNVFELQNAIGRKDVYKANLIITHMSKNPKTSSIIPVISNLYFYFTKILLVHSSQNKTQQALASLLGVNPFFVKDYNLAARNYSIQKCVHIISFLREYDTKSKGIDSPQVGDGELMKELIYKILHI